MFYLAHRNDYLNHNNPAIITNNITQLPKDPQTANILHSNNY